MSYKITGKIIAVMEKRSGMNERGTWAIQEYVLETQEQYPRKILFEAYGEDKIQEFFIHLDDLVQVRFDINAKQYNGKWYNSIRAWEVNHMVNVKFHSDED